MGQSNKFLFIIITIKISFLLHQISKMLNKISNRVHEISFQLNKISNLLYKIHVSKMTRHLD